MTITRSSLLIAPALMLFVSVANAQTAPDEKREDKADEKKEDKAEEKSEEKKEEKSEAKDEEKEKEKKHQPLAGYHNGLFFLRDQSDNFRLYIQGRGQVDAYGYFGAGVDKLQSLKPTVFLRRIRPEVTGEIYKNFVFMIAGEFGASAVDNTGGAATETRAAAPGAAPSATSGQYASAETVRITAQPTDVFVGGTFLDNMLNFQIGQFDANFTMENRTSDKYFDFLERSMAVRSVGIPSNKEIGLMLWGEPKNRSVFYSFGVYNGDGQNRLNMDGRGELMARVFTHPLFSMKAFGLEDAQIGGSIRYGSRDGTTVCSKDELAADPKCVRNPGVTYDYPGLSTQGGFTFWSPIYAGDNGRTHIMPSGDQLGVAGELRIPFGRFDLQSEIVYIDNNTRESVEGFQSTNTERLGHMFGFSHYTQLGFWAFGPRDINGKPGYENFAHLDLSKPAAPPKTALKFLVKYENVNLSYHSASRMGSVGTKNADGDITVHAFEVGANLWFTKHIRMSANYGYYLFPDSAPATPTNMTMTRAQGANGVTQRAQAPGNTLGTHLNDTARDAAHDLHELSLRFAIAL